MKKSTLLAVFCLLFLSLSAQAGLFDLSFGMDYDTAVETLEDQGFGVVDEYDDLVELVDWTSQYVEVLILVIDPQTDNLAGWYVVYYPQEEEEIGYLVFDAIISQSGENYTVAPETNVLTWDLSGGKGVEAYWNEAGDRFLAVYFDKAKLDLFTY